MKCECGNTLRKVWDAYDRERLLAVKCARCGYRLAVYPSREDREREVLIGLRALPKGWVRPMDIGGRNGSHHSRTLAALCRRGVVERRRRDTLINMCGGRRGSWCYRLAKEVA